LNYLTAYQFQLAGVMKMLLIIYRASLLRNHSSRVGKVVGYEDRYRICGCDW